MTRDGRKPLLVNCSPAPCLRLPAQRRGWSPRAASIRSAHARPTVRCTVGHDLPVIIGRNERPGRTSWPIGSGRCNRPTAHAGDPSTPAELESLGARIGAIDIEVEDIFDPAKPGESALPYRLANDLHMRTRADATRSQLLFDETQPYTRQKVAESERLLRGRRYLYDACIEPTCYHPDRLRDRGPGLPRPRRAGLGVVGPERRPVHGAGGLRGSAAVRLLMAGPCRILGQQ